MENQFEPQGTQPKSGGSGCMKVGCGLAIGGLVMLALCCGVGAWIASSVFSVIRESEPYQMAIERVTQDERVREVLGEPVEDATWLPMGNINFKNDSGDADLQLQVKGPNGEAQVSVQAIRELGAWTLTRLVVRLPDGQVIDLLEL